MTRKEIAELMRTELIDVSNETMNKFQDIIDEIYDDFEQKIKHLDNELTYELQLNRDLAFELSKMTKDRYYWKLSFNKQVEASR